MARFFCLSLNPKSLFLLSLTLSLLFTTAFAPRPGGARPDPENPNIIIDDPPPHPQKPPGGAEGIGEPVYSPFSTPQSESEEEGPDADDLADLFDKIKDLLEDIDSLLSPDSTSSSARPTLFTTATAKTTAFHSKSLTAISTSPTGQVNATLACEIYKAYTSLCRPFKATPYTTTFPALQGLGGITTTIDASIASQLADQSRASCLCYSSVYYVPQVYDDAAFYCAGYTTDMSDSSSSSADDAFAAAATSAAQTESFCSSIGNVDPGATAATFDEFKAVTTPSPTPTQSASPTGSTGAAGRLLGAERGTWECVVAVVVVAALI